MRVDVNTLIGAYPYRHLARAGVDDLLVEMDALAVTRAWTGSLSGPFHRDHKADNRTLYQTLRPHRDRLTPAPAIDPTLPRWEAALDEAVEHGATVIRVYPGHWGIATSGRAMRELAARGAEVGASLLFTVALEDVRQRHPHDRAPEVTAADLRLLVRAVPQARVIVTGGGRGLMEEVHWGLTPDEARRVWWDISLVWGPPADDLRHVVEQFGAERFLFGTQMPLRIGDASVVKLELSDLTDRDRRLIDFENAQHHLAA